MSDLYTDTTARIVTALAQGVAPWIRPWSTGMDAMPTNACTRRPYRGINVVLLAMEAQAHGYPLNRWLTYRQAAGLGGQVRKGEHGTHVVFWKLRTVEAKAETSDDSPSQRVFPLLRCFTVFNTAQIDGLPSGMAEPPPSTPAWPGEEAAERLINAAGADIRHGGFRAFYAPAADYIQIPPRPSFAAASGYYATTLHELVHWTGHASRLDRQLSGRFGDEAYAAEELIAELGSAFLCAHCRIDGQLQHASYIGNWLRVLRNDKRAIFVASAKAQHAADFLLARSNETSGAEALAA
jgi:antirestriction protein ArdC